MRGVLKEDKSNQGLYVHIPYCLNRCRYCSFYSTTGKIDEEDYLLSLFNHFVFLKNKFNFPPVFKTLYFGGGTPSLLSLNFFENFFAKLNNFMNIGDFEEITIETNPETLSRDYLKGLKKLGVNRISIGVQSTDNYILKMLGRVHSVEKAVKSVEYALDFFENVSLDFIIGIKGQSKRNVEHIFNFPYLKDVKHISVYMLEGEKNIDLKEDDDYCAEVYMETIDFLQSLGFYQYEISNFSKSGFESMHNTTYWNGNNYLGIGVSAHSFKREGDKGFRFYEQSDYSGFIKNSFSVEKFELKFEDMIKEFFMLGLRMKKGINIGEFEYKWGVNPCDFFKNQLERFNEFFLVNNDFIRLTREGFLISNEIFQDILF